MNAAPKRAFTRARSRSRRFAMQALYQWQMTGQDLALIDAQFLAEEDLEGVDVAYFQELLHQVPYRTDRLNGVLEPFLDRPLAQVDPVERSILWIAVYELTYRPDIPFRVVINEAVELAKKFGAEQGHRFVNGVLDNAARVVRT
jgi:N utilization substance protein B